jgi:GT2 family glycosyltransferase
MGDLRFFVYIIIPVHNRKAITLQCLETLKNNGVLDKYNIVIVDDGSTDGTSQAITKQYPDVIILYGDGNLWWTGAIKKGMEYAYEKGGDYFIWLNDDCYPEKNTIEKLISLCVGNHHLVVGSQCLDPYRLCPTYGGISIQKKRLESVSSSNCNLLECDALNGNLVCFHRQLIESIGYPDNVSFPHHLGDIVYTNKAKKNGYNLLINENALSFCKNDHQPISWLWDNKSILDYCNNYFDKQSYSYWKIELLAYKEIFGYIGFIYYFYQKIIKLFIIVLFLKPLPSHVKKKLSLISRFYIKHNK